MSVLLSEEVKPKKYMPYGNRELSSLSEQEKKALIVEALEAKGLRQTDAAALMNITRGYAAQLSKKKETGLLAPLAKIARKSVKQLAKGELVGNMKEIKGSDILGACNTILDRAEPKINKQEIKSLHANIEVTAEDRDRLLRIMGIIPVPANNAQIIDSNTQGCIVSVDKTVSD